ncbi:IS110 family transposase [Rhodocaloribacter sp.]
MKPYTHFVGIDVSKHTLDVALWRHDQGALVKASCQTNNDVSGHRQLMRWLSEQGAPIETSVLCLEHTGRYDDTLLEQLTLQGWICALEKTTVLQKVKPEHHRKDDSFDADLLAEYAYRYSDKLSLYRADNPVIEQIRLLYGERRRLVSYRAAVKQLQGEQGYNRAGKPNPAETLASKLWREQRALYDRQIKVLERKMAALINSDEDLRRRYEQVKGIDGIGPKTALKWLCLFYGEQHLDARRIASRFGFAPHVKHSGTSHHRGARSTGHGSSEVRKLMTMCARSAGTHCAKYRKYKARKLSEGKLSKVVTNNIINKLIRVMCAVWNADVAFNPNHVSRFVQNAVVAP